MKVLENRAFPQAVFFLRRMSIREIVRRTSKEDWVQSVLVDEITRRVA